MRTRREAITEMEINEWMLTCPAISTINDSLTLYHVGRGIIPENVFVYCEDSSMKYLHFVNISANIKYIQEKKEGDVVGGIPHREEKQTSDKIEDREIGQHDAVELMSDKKKRQKTEEIEGPDAVEGMLDKKMKQNMAEVEDQFDVIQVQEHDTAEAISSARKMKQIIEEVEDQLSFLTGEAQSAMGGTSDRKDEEEIKLPGEKWYEDAEE